MLLPQRVRPFIKVINTKYSRTNIVTEGMLTCCNTTYFELYGIGNVKKRFFSKMLLFPEGDRIVLQACCKQCAKRILVFDSDIDGYDTCKQSHVMTQLSSPIYCSKCNDNNYSIIVKYEYPDDLESFELEKKPADELFTWIWVDLICNNCGTKHYNFIDLETS